MAEPCDCVVALLRNVNFFGSLHTLLRDPAIYHPHVHVVVPGGGVSQDGSCWQAGPANFLLPEKAASTVYRAKFRDAMREAGLFDQIDSDVWKQKWVVNVEAVGDGRATWKYLAPYVYRAAISNNRIAIQPPAVPSRLGMTVSPLAITFSGEPPRLLHLHSRTPRSPSSFLLRARRIHLQIRAVLSPLRAP